MLNVFVVGVVCWLHALMILQRRLEPHHHGHHGHGQQPLIHGHHGPNGQRQQPLIHGHHGPNGQRQQPLIHGHHGPNGQRQQPLIHGHHGPNGQRQQLHGGRIGGGGGAKDKHHPGTQFRAPVISVFVPLVKVSLVSLICLLIFKTIFSFECTYF